jgi:multidrug efflux pump subunit AcrA (membrane-fusion protein)
MKRIAKWMLILILCLGMSGGIAYATGVLQLPAQPTASDTAVAVTTILDPVAAAPEPQSAAIVADAKVVPVMSADLGLTSSGIAVNVAVREGDVITPGQLVIQLDS